MIPVPAQIRAEIDAGALVVVNHSGGKDSQAMTIALRAIIPAEQLVVVHAHLAGVEWAGTEAHARATTEGLEFHTVAAGKTFLDMAERRGMFPSPKHRQCTSDLKRDPVAKLVRRLCRERGIDRVVQCLGLRAEESTDRARRATVRLDKRLSKAGRHVLEWLPIHHLTVEEVFATIAGAGERPHWAYAAGMTRLSCCFCIMASKADLTRAAELNPQLYRRIVDLEARIGFTLSPSQRTLPEITGIDPHAQDLEQRDPTGLVRRAIAAAAELAAPDVDLVALARA